MDDFRRKRVALLGAASLALAAASAWGVTAMPRIRAVSLKPRNDPPEVQHEAMSAAEAKRQRRAERNRKLQENSNG